jgi:hypothetical protein
MSPHLKFVIARVQGLFYVITGIWPIVHIDSFLFVTGPKHDLWLVQTVGALLAGIGIVMLLSTTEDRLGLTCKRLAIAIASVLAGADLLFAVRGIVSPVYLLDALVELLFLMGWVVTMVADKRMRRQLSYSAFSGHGTMR